MPARRDTGERWQSKVREWGRGLGWGVAWGRVIGEGSG